MAPIKSDVDRLAQILHCFGEITGLATNFQKISVIPIRCGHINLRSVLHNLSAKWSSFPMRYLGLSLSVWPLIRGQRTVTGSGTAGRQNNQRLHEA